MDFAFSPDRLTRFADVVDGARRLNTGSGTGPEQRFDRDRWNALAELGILGLSIPREFGGSGLGAVDTAHALEALGYGCTDTGLAFSAAAHLLACCMPVVLHGTPAAKKRLLPGLADGSLVAGNAVTEAEHGSDISVPGTAVVPDGDGLRITGTKSYVSNGPVADFYVVLGTADPASGFLGTVAVVVDRHQPGVRVGPAFAKMGLHSCAASIVEFAGAYAPADQQLGSAGGGHAVFQDSMRWERSCLFACYVGMLQRQFELCRDFARKRRQFGRPISANQAVSHRLVDMYGRWQSARLMLYKACWSLDRDASETTDVALAKLAVSEAAVASSLDAIQVFGGAGYLAEQGVEQMLRDAVPTTLFSGTSEMQREMIARELQL
ncbi:acyl-CoA dehydrogenase family protein [Saccharothrix sp. Mg75]|uniref:acyl-CoA dehydrogenase family protein n=1 Tax=Saccharothrix sp. Mg75 TaxID=3445357 RepID=UPI003EE9823F